jgi:hypothetical protein
VAPELTTSGDQLLRRNCGVAESGSSSSSIVRVPRRWIMSIVRSVTKSAAKKPRNVSEAVRS